MVMNGLQKNIVLGQNNMSTTSQPTNYMTKTRKTYTIQYLTKQPINRENWVVMTGFQYMQKNFAEGAFCMLRSFYGGNKSYRLIDSDNKIIAEWCTGTVGVN